MRPRVAGAGSQSLQEATTSLVLPALSSFLSAPPVNCLAAITGTAPTTVPRRSPAGTAASVRRADHEDTTVGRPQGATEHERERPGHRRAYHVRRYHAQRVGRGKGDCPLGDERGSHDPAGLSVAPIRPGEEPGTQEGSQREPQRRGHPGGHHRGHRSERAARQSCDGEGVGGLVPGPPMSKAIIAPRITPSKMAFAPWRFFNHLCRESVAEAMGWPSTTISERPHDGSDDRVDEYCHQPSEPAGQFYPLEKHDHGPRGDPTRRARGPVGCWPTAATPMITAGRSVMTCGNPARHHRAP